MGTILNAVKNLINSLTAKTSSTASTADMVQLHDANGNPNGKISLADLASVLGGMRETIPTNGDLNDYKDEGRFRTTSAASGNSISNRPCNGAFILNVYDGISSRIQVHIPFSADSIYIRKYQVSSGTWSPWYQFSGAVVE